MTRLAREPQDETPAPAAAGAVRRCASALLRSAAIAAGAWLLLSVPLGSATDWLPAKNVFVAVAAVVLTGKCLFDTFFYDHFRP